MKHDPLNPLETALLAALRELEPDPKKPCPPRRALASKMPKGFAGAGVETTGFGILSRSLDRLRHKRAIGPTDWRTPRGRESGKWRVWMKATLHGSKAKPAPAPPADVGPPAKTACPVTLAFQAQRDALTARHAVLIAKASRLERLEEAWSAV